MGIGRDIFYALGLAATSPVWGAGMLRTGKWRTDWGGRFGKVRSGAPSPRSSGPASGRILIHAVSVGEVNLVRRLVGELEAAGVEVVVATTTNTGFERATKLYSERHRVVRYPLDFTFAVRRFLDAVRPDAVALAELELWPNFAEACERRGIPICIVNGRLSERSFRRYKLARPVLRSTFAKVAAAGVQTQAYAERFKAMGVPADRVHVLDTMKWDTAEVADTVPGAGELAAEMGIVAGDASRPVVVLGSTGEGEERALADAVRGACGDAFPGVQVVVVPRKPERFDEVAGALGVCVRRTQTRGGAAGLEPHRLGPGATFLIDTLGELRKAYALADVVIVGRSFNGWGGSDPIESVGLGKPTIVGPDHENFRDAVNALCEGGGLVVASTPEEAAGAAARLLADREAAARLAKRGREVILSRQGSTRRHAEMLLRVLRAPERLREAASG